MLKQFSKYKAKIALVLILLISLEQVALYKITDNFNLKKIAPHNFTFKEEVLPIEEKNDLLKILSHPS